MTAILLVLAVNFIIGQATPATNISRMLQTIDEFKLPRNAVTTKWYYQKRSSISYSGCTRDKDDKEWIMLNAYRGGGLQGWHWKFTKDENDKHCLTNWTYYGKDGMWVMKHVKGRLTTDNKNRTWCAMAVYRRGGIRGFEWDYCTPV